MKLTLTSIGNFRETRGSLQEFLKFLPLQFCEFTRSALPELERLAIPADITGRGLL